MTQIMKAIMPKGSNPNSHGNRPPVGVEKKIRMPDRLWDAAIGLGNGNQNAGVRAMAEVAIGTKGILWAVPLSPVKIPRVYPVIPHEHITLQYAISRKDVDDQIGAIFTAPIIGVTHNDRIQAAKVILPAGIDFRLKIPHITLSMQDGVAPIESTAMLEEASSFEEIEQRVTFRIEFFEFQA